jgi:hypothetical protein
MLHRRMEGLHGRFLIQHPAEADYARIEGECLGVASALHKTRYYTQGCNKLLIGTDHKPLLSVLNDRSLE